MVLKRNGGRWIKKLKPVLFLEIESSKSPKVQTRETFLLTAKR
jgi:hypothetical protein